MENSAQEDKLSALSAGKCGRIASLIYVCATVLYTLCVSGIPETWAMCLLNK